MRKRGDREKERKSETMMRKAETIKIGDEGEVCSESWIRVGTQGSSRRLAFRLSALECGLGVLGIGAVPFIDLVGRRLVLLR